MHNFFSSDIELSLKMFGLQIQWLYSQGHLDLQMTFKSRFLILCVLQIKYLVFCTYWPYKFWVGILKVMDSELDLQMTFKSQFLILCVLQIKYFVFCTYWAYTFWVEILKVWTWPSNDHQIIISYIVCITNNSYLSTSWQSIFYPCQLIIFLVFFTYKNNVEGKTF